MAPTPEAPPTGGANDPPLGPAPAHPGDPRDRAVASWLLACAALVACMVLLGGVTRLTGSGLSIVEWRPVTGVVPPLGAAAWEEELARYRQSPEFRLRNPDMDLAGFQRIFWIEWAHRFLGRLVGVAFALPLVWFAWRGRLRGLLPRLLAILALGGAQGALGWYMVASGLVDKPHVSPYRLTAHLMLALLLLAALVWTALGLLERPAARRQPRRLTGLARAATAAVVLTLVWGGFMAGTRAGYAYATFPLIHGQLLPPGAWQLQPWWANPFENLLTVQLLHRGLALLSLALIAAWWWAGERAGAARHRRLRALLALGALQVGLGAATVVLGVPTAIAVLHQAGGVALLTACLVAGHGVLLPVRVTP